MGGKLTPEQRAFMVSLAEITINVAKRHPALRGPWIFDEEQLQAQAKRARKLLRRLREATHE